MLFALSMVLQVSKGLQQLHEFGFAHSDLKLENICARIDSNKKFKFTLIDFGVVTRLPKIGQSFGLNEKLFRGNLLTASLEHIQSHRSSVIDDIYSLLCVAYQFVFEKLPWHEKLDKLILKHNLSLSKEEYQGYYIRLRIKYAKLFDKQLAQKGEELSQLFKLIIEAGKAKRKLEMKYLNRSRISTKYHSIKYDLFFK